MSIKLPNIEDDIIKFSGDIEPEKLLVIRNLQDAILKKDIKWFTRNTDVKKPFSFSWTCAILGIANKESFYKKILTSENKNLERALFKKKRNRVPLHGNINEYNNYGCRCDACKEAARIHRKLKKY